MKRLFDGGAGCETAPDDPGKSDYAQAQKQVDHSLVAETAPPFKDIALGFRLEFNGKPPLLKLLWQRCNH